MAILRDGLVSTDEAFGSKGALLENTIKKIGWSETPFLSAIGTAAPRDRSVSVALGHSWYYDELPEGDLNNAHAEGSPKAQAKKYSGGSLKNHFQIVKNTYGVTGSEAPATEVDGNSKLIKQGEMTSVEHKKSIERILLSDQAAVARVNSGSTVIGKCGGLKSFATAANTIDASGADLSMQLIRDLLKVGYLKGRPYEFIMVNDNQNDKLLDLLDKMKQANIKQKYLEDEVLAITNTYGKNVKVLLSPFLADNEIIAFRSDDIYKVNWRPMFVRELTSSDDVKEKEIVSEITLRVCTPVAFAWLKNLKA